MPLFIGSQLISDDGLLIGRIAEHRWYPVYCRPNKERKLQQYAVSKDISCYLPEIERLRVVRGRRIVTMAPMFTGYVFLCLSRQQNWEIKKSRYFLRMLPIDDENEQILVDDLNIVRKFEVLARKRKVEVRPELAPGKRVVITDGELRGCEGIVKQRKGRREIIVNLEFLGGCLAVLEAHELELA